MTEAERRSLGALVARLLGADTTIDHAALPVAGVRRHLLGPLAYQAGAAALRADFITSALQAERRGALLGEVLTALAAAGVDVILLKGIAYAGSVYAEPAERPMSDIDLLVPAAAFERGVRALARLGYWHAGGPAQLTVTRHALTLKRHGSAIDLHRHILHAGRSRMDLGVIWRDARPAHVGGARRPAPVHEYLLHVAHIGRHEGAVPLVNYVDAHRLRAALPADADVAGLARAWSVMRATRAVERTLIALRQPGAVPPGRLVFPSVDELLLGEPAARWLQITRKLRMVDDLRGLAGFAVATVRSRLAPLRR